MIHRKIRAIKKTCLFKSLILLYDSTETVVTLLCDVIFFKVDQNLPKTRIKVLLNIQEKQDSNPQRRFWRP